MGYIIWVYEAVVRTAGGPSTMHDERLQDNKRKKRYIGITG